MNASQQYALPFRGLHRDDICRRRHRGNAQSDAANQRVAPHKERLCDRVEDAFLARGAQGYTTSELAAALHLGYTTASARVSELKRAGALVATEHRRETGSGCSAAVVVHAKYRGAHE